MEALFTQSPETKTENTVLARIIAARAELPKSYFFPAAIGYVATRAGVSDRDELRLVHEVVLYGVPVAVNSEVDIYTEPELVNSIA